MDKIEFTQDRLISVGAVANICGCSVSTVWRRTSDQTLPKPIKICGMTRWSHAELVSFVKNQLAGRSVVFDRNATPVDNA